MVLARHRTSGSQKLVRPTANPMNPRTVLAVVSHWRTYDAADGVPPAAAGNSHDLLAILAPVEPLDLPDVGLDPLVLELADGLNHQPGPDLQIVGLAVAFDSFQLRLLRRHQQLEHVPAAVVVVQVIGE